MRFRIFDEATTTRNYRRRWQYAGQSPNWDYEDAVTRVTRKDHMLDVVTPGFSRKRNKGDIICSPMLKEKLYHDVDHTVARMVGRDSWSSLYYDTSEPSILQVVPVNGYLDALGGTMNTLFQEFDREVSLAVMRAHADVNVSEMSLLATLGELPETIRWIQSILKRLIGITKAFKDKATLFRLYRDIDVDSLNKKELAFSLKRFEKFVEINKRRAAKRKKAGATGQDVTDFWLEWRYAVRPLIFDLRNAVAALNTKIVSQRLTARGREYSKGESKTSIYKPPNPDSNSLELWGTLEVKESIQARAGCLYVIDGHITSMLDILGLDQPLEALWDLTPLSFVLDWAFSIGDLLESWFKSSGLSILTSWVTLKVERTEIRKITSAKMHSDRNTTWSSQQLELGSSHSVVSWKWRVPNPPLPLLPRLDLKLDLAKIIDLGAIGRKSISGRIPEVALRS